MSEKAANI